MPEGISISPQPSDTGSVSVGNVVRKFTGKTTAPTVDDDITAGYIVSDIWIDETGDAVYVCVDNSDGAAVWKVAEDAGSVATHAALTTGTHGVTGTILGTEDVDDTPVDGATTAPISSNWAYDHNARDATNAVQGHATAAQIAALEAATAAQHTQDTDTNLGAVGTKNPPIDADLTLYRDSTAANALVTSTWTQIKAFLKTYFDGLYNLYTHPNHIGDVTSIADGAQTIVNKQTMSATAPITVSNTPTVIAAAAPVIAIPAATNIAAGHATAAHIQAIESNTAKNTNVPTALSVGTVGVNTVAITSDGGADDVTLPAATVDTAGMLTTAKWAEIVANTAKISATGANTALTSILNAALYLGRDADNKIDWGTDDQLKITIAGVLSAIASISTGVADNDKLVTQGYVDDNAGGIAFATAAVLGTL